MRDRRTFLSSLGAASFFAAAVTREVGANEPAKRAKGPSAAALVLAATYRRFDPKLTDDEIATIARGIDDNAKAAAPLNPKKRRLRNSDDPVTIFTVRE